MELYELNVCQVMIFGLYTVEDKHEMIKIRNKTREKSHVFSQALKQFCWRLQMFTVKYFSSLFHEKNMVKTESSTSLHKMLNQSTNIWQQVSQDNGKTNFNTLNMVQPITIKLVECFITLQSQLFDTICYHILVKRWTKISNSVVPAFYFSSMR